jgi:hypothetical protein
MEYEKLYNNRMPACSKAKGETVSKTVTILDLGGVSFSQFTSEGRNGTDSRINQINFIILIFFKDILLWENFKR